MYTLMCLHCLYKKGIAKSILLKITGTFLLFDDSKLKQIAIGCGLTTTDQSFILLKSLDFPNRLTYSVVYKRVRRLLLS